MAEISKKIAARDPDSDQASKDLYYVWLLRCAFPTTFRGF